MAPILLLKFNVPNQPKLISIVLKSIERPPMT